MKFNIKHMGVIVVVICLVAAIGLFGATYYERHFCVDPFYGEAPNPAAEKSALKDKKIEDKKDYAQKGSSQTVSEESNGQRKDNDSISSAPKEQIIYKDEARQKALSHAGVQAEGIREYKIELDREKAVIVYEIEFKSGRYEYDYELDAKSGKIIKSEKEFDD